MSILKSHLLGRLIKNQKGVSAILVAIVLPVLLGFTALAIDVGYMYATKNELQNIADAAALAGAGELGQIYLGLDPKDHASHVLDNDQEDQITLAAQAVADLNKHANENAFLINTADISIGIWDWELSELDTSSVVSPDAVQVIARRDASANGPVTTFFASIFSIFGGNHETFESSAIATAALSGAGTLAEGILKAPFGISYQFFVDDTCPDTITFNSAQDNLPCSAWHNFHDPINPPSNTDLLDQGEKMLSFINEHTDGEDWLDLHFTDWNKLGDVETQISGETSIGDLFYFTWGVQNLIKEENSSNTVYYNSSDWINDPNNFYSDPSKKKAPNPLSTAFHFWRFRDGDGDDSKWTTTVPVYDQACGDAANTAIQIVGFAEIAITGVHGPSEPQPLTNSIDVEIDCNLKIKEGRGGGGNKVYGNIMGSIPNLVQ